MSVDDEANFKLFNYFYLYDSVDTNTVECELKMWKTRISRVNKKLTNASDALRQ